MAMLALRDQPCPHSILEDVFPFLASSHCGESNDRKPFCQCGASPISRSTKHASTFEPIGVRREVGSAVDGEMNMVRYYHGFSHVDSAGLGLASKVNELLVDSAVSYNKLRR